MSKVISAEVPDELADRIDATRAGEPPDYDESRSAAVKRIIRRGLDADEDTGAVPLTHVAQTVGAMLVGAAFASTAEVYGVLGVVLLFGPAINQWLSLTDRLS